MGDDKKLRRALGGELAMLRGRTGMTQETLAPLIGVHAVTLRYWEIGKSVPKAANLRSLIETLAQRGVWENQEEIRTLWNRARQAGLKDALDEQWFAELHRNYALPKSGTSNEMPANAQVPTTNTSTKINEPLSGTDERPSLENIASSRFNEAGESSVFYGSDLFFKHQDRRCMLDIVYSIWIQGLLETSLKNVVEIELELHEQPDIVVSPWKQHLQEVQQPREEVTSSLRILDAYQRAHGKLLILGEPGSGKTTLLLQLTRALLERAIRDIAHPIPVIFSLASWVEKRQSIEKWLVEELNAKYHIPAALGQQWINQNQLLPLFDGLDEVGEHSYSSCVEALNTYLKEHGLVPTVICSRRSAYLNQPKRLLLHNAVCVQLLTDQQISTYTQNYKKDLQDVFNHDSVLSGLARTPLMLHILTTSYENGAMGTTYTGYVLDIQRQAFTTYILQMFKRRSPHVRYTARQTIQYLQWLARKLQQQKQTNFYIEFMQFDWLPVSWLRQLYPALAVALVYGLLLSLGFGISYLPYFSFSQVLIFFLLIAAFSTLVYGFFNGIVFGVLATDQVKETQTSLDQHHHTGIRQKVIATLGNRVIYGILNGLLSGTFVGLVVSPVSGCICGLFSCAFCAGLGKLEAQVKCAEYLEWSGSSMLRNAYKFLAGGLLVGLLYGLVTGRDYLFAPAKLFPSLLLGLGIGLLVGLILSIRGGFTHKPEANTDNILKPNQGIRRSLYNSLFFGSFFGIAFGLLFGLIYGPVLFLVLGQEYKSSFPTNSGLVYGVSDGLIVAAFFWLLSGGIACIQHTLLRLLLWMHGSIPWNYAQFLDHAVDLALLYKVGAGYMFSHGLLQEYFETLDDTEMKILLDHSNTQTKEKY
ncbi:MAG: NACHT domain-containing protein [Ktedonobacteraceae bacterium]|nr:NACHT domain-containing protein [Ktedonobacteraceae bacterium]